MARVARRRLDALALPGGDQLRDDAAVGAGDRDVDGARWRVG